MTATAIKTETTNRRGEVLDTAARLFARHGYAATSIRDIATDVGMQPSSIYYFFKSKDELFAAVYAEGVERILAAVQAATRNGGNPWQRLRQGAVAHLESLLNGGDYAAVVIKQQPERDDDLRDELVAYRDRYETMFGDMVAELPLTDGSGGGGADLRYLRLTLLGALNSVVTWYQPGGDTPAVIAGHIIDLIRSQLDPEATP
ncbi:MAG: TetR/AcrR family transcriptional regulator [Alphaproteobacteria bacterium]|jgi:AcrR family transcriptional regulator|nr:TetR/AcrR family transcriptional regulator [Alphaproteobacteria bacterium]MDP7602855.1 TetR/AcrR family transcriptional regulator [Alphaproteobacteria bacterium]HJP20515.1 TetR/AcrR family transcriptional regulator [Alphaproteobacteria bacterium]